MRFAALALGILAVTLGLLRRFSRTHEHRTDAIDAGTVSESWLAEQRGVRNDQSSS